MNMETVIQDEQARREAFPVTAECVFLGHAGVSPLPRVAVDLMRGFLDRGSRHKQEGAWTETWVNAARTYAAELLGAEPREIALLGPTSLGLSLVAAGLPWHQGDEVVYYQDDYPANVYPWTALARRGVKPCRVAAKRRALYLGVGRGSMTDRTRRCARQGTFPDGFALDVDTLARNLTSAASCSVWTPFKPWARFP